MRPGQRHGYDKTTAAAEGDRVSTIGLHGSPKGTSLDGVIYPGLIAARWDRAVRNGYWFLANSKRIQPVGWGDLSFTNLEALAASLRAEETFVAVHESHHRAIDSLYAAGPTTDLDPSTLADIATYAVADSTVWVVDHAHQANRQGAIWIRPGYRTTRTGRTIRRAPRRTMALEPDELLRRLQSTGTDAPAAGRKPLRDGAEH